MTWRIIDAKASAGTDSCVVCAGLIIDPGSISDKDIGGTAYITGASFCSDEHIAESGCTFQASEHSEKRVVITVGFQTCLKTKKCIALAADVPARFPKKELELAVFRNPVRLFFPAKPPKNELLLPSLLSKPASLPKKEFPFPVEPLTPAKLPK
jgi:hypothetical protein